MKYTACLLAAAAALATSASAFNVNCNSNYVSYYGQNSAGNQKTLGAYCQDATEDVIVLSFMNGFPNILLNFANACETTFPGSTLLHCPTIASDIKYCQSRGKAVILSMGGASGAYGFSSDAQGAEFADTVWDMFFKGSAAQRPFDDAVLDGIDLDIEGGSPTGYAAFINKLRTHYASDPTRKYYIAAAPQCPFPDAYVGSTLNSAWFDMVFVQFYNNYCGLNAYPGWFNFGDWDNWAKTQSINKDIRVFIGAPGSPSAASSGYIDGSTLGKIYKDMLAKHTSLGGIMTWDVSQSRTSGIASTIRSFLDASGSCSGNGGEVTAVPPSSSASSSSSNPSTSPASTTAASSSTSSTVSTSTTAATTASPTSATTTTTASSTNTTPTAAPANCPVSGERCTGNEQGCSGSSFALCNNGRWYVAPCAGGTYCYLTNGIAMCDWANGRPTDGCSSTSNSTAVSTSSSMVSTTSHSSTASTASTITTTTTGTTRSGSPASSTSAATTQSPVTTATSSHSTTSSVQTSSSTQPSPTSAPSNCPVNGVPCKGNQQGCSGSRYALCNNGAWYVAPCAGGTYCYLSGSIATCDWSNGRPTDGCAVSSMGDMFQKRQNMTMVGAIVKPQLLPKPADAAGNIRARVEFVVGEIDNDKYSTVVKIQTLKDPFSSKWGLSFTLPANQTIESTSRGFVRVVNNTVTVTSDNAAEPEKNMAAIFKITGLFGGEYVLPSATSAVFTST